MAIAEPEAGIASINPEEPTTAWAGLTARSAVVGVCLSGLINLGAAYSKHFLRSTYLASDFMPLGLVFPFFLLVTVGNGLLKMWGPRLAFSRRELVVIFIMGLVATTVPTVGLTGTLLTTITSPYYYATPENNWTVHVTEALPKWLAPVGDDGTAIRWFYEGLPPDQVLPWEAWVVPLFWWLSMIAAVIFTCTCIVVMLRRQWVDKERLPYPLVEVPLLLTEEAERQGFLPPFMRERLFWIGFAIPLFLLMWNLVGFWNPHWPVISERGAAIVLSREFPQIPVRIYFPVLGFAYLINVQVAFSIWFFYLLGLFEVGILNRLGVALGTAEPYSTYHPVLSSQGIGALLTMVLWGLYVARGHLRDVWRKAIYRDVDVDDSDEMMSYRTALFGAGAALLYMSLWLAATGMDLFTVLIFLPTAFLIFIGVARIVVEGGLVFMRAPMLPQSLATVTLGTVGGMSTPSLLSLAMNYSWFSDVKCAFIAAAAHASKLVERARVGRKAVFLGIVVSMGTALICSIGYTILMGYDIGAFNMDRWLFQSAGKIPYTNAVKKILNPQGPDTARLGIIAGGALFMGLLVFMRYRISWWPLAPIGFPIAGVQQVRNTAITIFLAWAIKVLLLKIGGNKLYHRAMPFFFGITLGYYTGLGICWLVDAVWFPGGQGHYLYGV